jgi:transposase
VDASTTPPENTAAESPRAKEIRGPVLEVLGQLLPEFDERGAVLAMVEKLLAQNNQLVVRNTELQRQLSKFVSATRTSEKVSAAQLLLALGALGMFGSADADGSSDGERAQPEDLDAADADLRKASGIDEERAPKDDQPKTGRPRRQPYTRTPAPAHLRRVENPIPVPDAERPCPKCGGERTCIGHDTTEVIDLIPAEAIVRLDMREKLRCEPCDGELVRAPIGDKVVSGGKFGLVFIAQLLIGKYVDGLPLHRQRECLARLGLDVSVSTLADQVKWSTDLLMPLWRAAFSEVVAARVMHVDGTGLPVLDPQAAGGKRFGTLWGYVGVSEDLATALYLYTSTGKKVGQKPGELGPEDVLALRVGPTVADASNIFDVSFKRLGLIECGCNMHSRRYFVKALDSGDKRAALPIAAYKKLYEIEAAIRDRDPAGKLAERVAQSKPIFDEIVAWCLARQPHEPPSSKLGAAIRYMLNHRVALGRFLEDGIIPIDNGPVERLHIRAALTRKNFLFAGADSGGERAAIAFTIFGSCRLAGVDPLEYLSDVLPRLTRPIRLVDLPSLLPAAWKAQRAIAASQAEQAATLAPSA